MDFLTAGMQLFDECGVGLLDEAVSDDEGFAGTLGGDVFQHIVETGAAGGIGLEFAIDDAGGMDAIGKSVEG